MTNGPVNVGVVGATGQVGTKMLEILTERAFPVGELRLFASARSAGRTIEWNGREITVEDAATADYAGVDIAHVLGRRRYLQGTGAEGCGGGRGRHRQLVGMAYGPGRAPRRGRRQR